MNSTLLSFSRRRRTGRNRQRQTPIPSRLIKPGLGKEERSTPMLIGWGGENMRER